jgi:NodT family efflux transporter outer membrane factor (OMF) lipoprotein
MTMKRFSLIAVAVACALSLVGCAVGPEFERPAAPADDRYTAAPLQAHIGATNVDDAQRLLFDQAPTREWWRRFQSAALDRIVQRAIDGNRTLASASYALAEAQELAAARSGARYPRIDGTAGVGREKYGAQFLGPLPKPPPFSYFSVGASISYSLDFTGGVGRSIEQQRALAEYRQHQLEAAELAVSGNAVLQILQIASLKAQIATIESLLERDRANLNLVEEAFEAGSVSRLDVVSAQTQLAGDATLLAPLRRDLSAARHALAVIVGSTPAASAVEDVDLADLTLPAELPVTIPSELAHRRPDILSAESQLHAATAAVGVATANLYPRIDLTGSTGQQANQIEDLLKNGSNVWSIAAGLVAPIFDGGTLRAERRAAVNAMQASAANYQQTVLEAFAQVADALDALGQGAESLRAQASAEAAARENVELTRQSYNAGQVGILEVLDAERRYQQARLGFVQARAQRYVDTAQLFLALGGSGATP